MNINLFLWVLCLWAATSCTTSGTSEQTTEDVRTALRTFSEGTTMSEAVITPEPTSDKREIAVLGAGCFWCVEAVFQRLDGVISVASGYTGGKTPNPTYKEVCSGTTGHAEVCRIEFNPDKISFTDILEVFFATHDPTTLNRQGNDVGTQYRSAVFYTSEQQRSVAEKMKEFLNTSGAFQQPIVTEIVALGDYYPAEDYHQNYFNENPEQAYCSFVVRPKVDKFMKAFKDKLKKEALQTK